MGPHFEGHIVMVLEWSYTVLGAHTRGPIGSVGFLEPETLEAKSMHS